MSDYKGTPLWDNSLPIEERLDYLIRELTLEEKISCLTTGCPDIERLGIRASYMGGEAAHGIEARHDQAFNAGEPEPTTCFTQPIGMSGSFDRELIRKCGKAVGEEARALFTRGNRGGLCRWAPTVDMERDPRWGRNEEAYGEDPYLTGEMASAYIRGMKGEDPFYIQCGATLKHFYANNIERDRIKISSSVDMRNKYEYYLEPFRKAIEEGGAEAVMTSYNEINGVPAIVNCEVQKLLKDTYGLPGHVVCDGGDFQQTVNDHQYFKTHAQTLACGLKAGVDCFTDDREVVFAAAREALSKDLITEEDIDRSVRNSFRTRIRLGFFDKEGECPYTGMGEEFVNNEEHRSLSAKMAQEAVVLLKNEGNLLPLNPSETKSLAVIGPLADVWYKDWYGGIPPYSITLLEGIKKEYSQTAVSYESGLSDIYITCNGKYIGLDRDNRLYLTNEEQAEIFSFTDWGCGSTTLVASSNQQYVSLEENSELIKATRKEAFSWFIRESFRFTDVSTGSVDVNVDDKEASYYINCWNGKKTAIDENGYLTVTDGEPSVFGIKVVTNGIRDAVEAAAKAEKVIVAVGSNPVINSKEEVDRTTLALPPFQQKLIDAVHAVNSDTVVILVTNYPYAITKLQEEIPALLYSPSGSQELGSGIAAVLCGKVSPAGRLPQTWYLSDKDLPDINEYDIIQGERTYQYFKGEVLYPFGYGLSYSEFTYGSLTLKKNGEEIKAKLTIKNAGEVMADEVVQLYVHKETSRVKQPVSRLVAFERVKGLAPGETREISFRVLEKDLRYYDVISKSMKLESSVYTFMAGASSKDIRQQASLTIVGDREEKRNPFAWTEAVLYDRSKNCFVHRGCKGHAVNGETCMIPGKPGENPDIVDKSPENKTSCELYYNDFKFEKYPEKVLLCLCAAEEGEITLSCRRKGREEGRHQIPVGKNKESDFTLTEVLLPEEWIKESDCYDLEIMISGKIKLSRFQFEKGEKEKQKETGK